MDQTSNQACVPTARICFFDLRVIFIYFLEKLCRNHPFITEIFAYHSQFLDVQLHIMPCGIYSDIMIQGWAIRNACMCSVQVVLVLLEPLFIHRGEVNQRCHTGVGKSRCVWFTRYWMCIFRGWDQNEAHATCNALTAEHSAEHVMTAVVERVQRAGRGRWKT